jgi:hypothetical protein
MRRHQSLESEIATDINSHVSMVRRLDPDCDKCISCPKYIRADALSGVSQNGGRGSLKEQPHWNVEGRLVKEQGRVSPYACVDAMGNIAIRRARRSRTRLIVRVYRAFELAKLRNDFEYLSIRQVLKHFAYQAKFTFR